MKILRIVLLCINSFALGWLYGVLRFPFNLIALIALILWWKNEKEW